MTKSDAQQKADTNEEKVDSRIEELEGQSEEWKNKYLRALADYQNLEKRTHAEKNEIRQYASEGAIKRLLPVIDTFERAAAHVKDTGLDLALKELAVALTELGVKKFAVVGKSFDPHSMECVEVVAGKENIVVEEVLPGYELHGKIIRVAQVKVGKALSN